MKKDIIKKCLFFSFLIIAITIVISIVVKYNVEGEKTLPYKLDKLLIISRLDTENNNDETNLWNINLNQNNNIFIYLSKTNNTNETIKEIKLENFKITSKPKIGNIKIYRPTGDLNNLYEYSKQDYLNSNITFEGSSVDTLKNLEIGNTGGMLGFRISLENFGNYISNNADEELIYDASLLQKAGVNLEDTKFSISFDILISLNSNITYKGTIDLNLPTENIIDDPESFIEITNFDNVVFKRIEK